jgi:hypothetical protein
MYKNLQAIKPKHTVMIRFASLAAVPNVAFSKSYPTIFRVSFVRFSSIIVYCKNKLA